MRAAVLTVSDGVHAGERDDRSGEVLEELLAAEGFEVVRRVVPDEQSAISDRLFAGYVRFAQGQPYSPERVRSTQFALEDSNYFSTITVIPGDRDPNTLTVPVPVRSCFGAPVLKTWRANSSYCVRTGRAEAQTDIATRR